MESKIFITFLVFLISSYSIIFPISGDNDISLFYQSSHVQPYSCSFELDSPLNFDCACVTGLWFLYDSCEEIRAISGRNRHCTRLSGSPSNGTIKSLNWESVKEAYIDEKVLLITGAEWTLIDESGLRICVSAAPEPNSFCFFANDQSSPWTLYGLEMGCGVYDYFVESTKCIKVGEDTSNICENIKRKRISKREADNSSLGIPDLIPEDEDYAQHQLAASNPDPPSSSPISIEKGIIDYMMSQLEEQLRFETVEPPTVTPKSDKVAGASGGNQFTADTDRAFGASLAGEEERNKKNGTDNLLNVTYTNPVYEFLELSKRITQITCPVSYVKPEFLNVATATFIRMQQLEFNFPENSFKPIAFKRVLNALRECEKNAKPFEFLDGGDCKGKVNGLFSAFGENFEVKVPSEYADLNRDPIVETVWKVFFNAHSYCFPFFNKTLLDHHRFITWMLPLFQNQMNDLWTQGKTSKSSFDGLFGDQVLVQGHLGYCVVASHMVANYPWVLPKPNRVSQQDTEEDPNDAEDTQRRRRKREVSNIHPLNNGKCIDSDKPMLCPVHIQSIAKS